MNSLPHKPKLELAEIQESLTEPRTVNRTALMRKQKVRGTLFLVLVLSSVLHRGGEMATSPESSDGATAALDKGVSSSP